MPSNKHRMANHAGYWKVMFVFNVYFFSFWLLMASKSLLTSVKVSDNFWMSSNSNRVAPVVSFELALDTCTCA